MAATEKEIRAVFSQIKPSPEIGLLISDAIHARPRTIAESPYPTLRAAYAGGWKKLEESHYGGDLLVHQCRSGLYLLTTNANRSRAEWKWKREGYRPIPGQKPHHRRLAAGGAYRPDVAEYRRDQVERVGDKGLVPVDEYLPVDECLRVIKQFEEGTSQ